MDVLKNNKLIHQLSNSPTNLVLSLWLQQSTKEYVLYIKFSDQNLSTESEEDLFDNLFEVENYYQCLITPPIVAAAQKEFIQATRKIQVIRSAPGLGKLHGRSRLKIQADGVTTLLGQLFRLLHPQETYGLPCYLADSELGKRIQLIFMSGS